MADIPPALAVLLTAPLLLPLQVVAENPLEETVITASRTPTLVGETATSISILDRDQIRLLGYPSLQDALRMQTGVSANNAGGAGKATSVRIRGEEGFRTLAILDGIDISDTSATQIGPRFEHIMAAGVERVEILRGPQGLMYGADAGGVVAIESRTPDRGLSGEATLEAGRYDSQSGSAWLGYGGERISSSLLASRFETGGFNARLSDVEPADSDGYENTSLHGRLDWALTDAISLTAAVHNVEGDNEYDGCFDGATFAPSNDCDDSFEQQAWRVALSADADAWTHRLAHTQSSVDKAFYSNGEPGFLAGGERSRSTWISDWNPEGGFDATFGAEIQRDSLADGSFDRERDQHSGFVEARLQPLPDTFVSLGARHDDNEDFGGNTSLRVGASHLLSLASGVLQLKASAGSGFRAPSLYEIAYNDSFGFAAAGSTPLEAETSVGIDAGLTWADERGRVLELVLYDQTIEDEILFDLESFSGYLQTPGESTSRGLEAAVDTPLPAGFSISANYTYSDTETASGSARPFRPRHLGNVGLHWQSPAEALEIGFFLRAVGESRGIAQDRIAGYEVASLSANYRIRPGVEIFGRIENLFDADYEEIPDYRSSGQAAWAGLRIAFGGTAR